MSKHVLVPNPNSYLLVFANDQAIVRLCEEFEPAEGLTVAVPINAELADQIADDGVLVTGDGVEIQTEPSFLTFSSRNTKGVSIDPANPFATLVGEEVELKVRGREKPVKGKLVCAGTPGKGQSLQIAPKSGTWISVQTSKVRRISVIDDDELNALVAEALDEAVERRKNARLAYILVTLNISRRTTVTFEWCQSFPAWATSYKLDLGANDTTASLEMTGVITSNLGFDFTGTVVLSTRRPGRAADDVGEAPRRLEPRMQVRTLSLGPESLESMTDVALERAPRAKSRGAEALVKSDGIVEYRLPRVTLHHDRKETPAIFSKPADVKAVRSLRYTSGRHPKITVTLRNTTETTFLGGRCRVYDKAGDYLGQGSLRTTAPREKNRISCGDDERIRVTPDDGDESEFIVIASAAAGVFVGNHVLERTARFAIRNTDSEPVLMTLVVAKDEKMPLPTVETERGLEVLGDPAVKTQGTKLEYQLNLAPYEGGERQVLSLGYRIESDVELRMDTGRVGVLSVLQGNVVDTKNVDLTRNPVIARALEIQGEISTLDVEIRTLLRQTEQDQRACDTLSRAIEALRTKPDHEVVNSHIQEQERALSAYTAGLRTIREKEAARQAKQEEQNKLLTEFVLGQPLDAAAATP